MLQYHGIYSSGEEQRSGIAKDACSKKNIGGILVLPQLNILVGIITGTEDSLTGSSSWWG